MKHSVIKHCAVAALAAVLAACGSGGGSSGGPAVTSPLSQQSATTLAKAAVDAANSSTQLSSAAASASSAGSAPAEKSLVGKAVALSYDCAGTAQLRSLCAGQFSLNSNFTPVPGSGIPAGSTLSMSFLGFRALSAPADQAATGTVSVTFADAFSSSTMLNGAARIRVDMITPAPEVHSDVTMAFHNMSVAGTGSDQTLSGSATLTASGLPTLEIGFTNWHNIGTTPQPGSLARLRSGDDSVSISVVGSSATQTGFDVTTSIAGATPVTRRVVRNVVNGQAVFALQ